MLLSIVMPVFNEAQVLPLTLLELRRVLDDLGCDWEVVFVNDGSRDPTAAILEMEAKRDRRIKAIHFARNFGHQLAVTAGLDFASGDAVVVMDADLQDPPDLLPQMLDLYREGYDVVSPQRISRHTDSHLKRWTAQGFYWIMRKMVDPRLQPEVGDFRLFSRMAVLNIRQFREQHRFMRGLVAWLGLREVLVPFERRPRAAGETKYPFWKMLRFAWTAISSFSALPLRMAISCGIALSVFGALYSLFSIYQALVLHITVPGWTSLVCIQSLFSGAILLAIGLVGDYVARIYEEAKGRPLYVVQNTANLAAPPGSARSVVLVDRDTEMD